MAGVCRCIECGDDEFLERFVRGAGDVDGEDDPPLYRFFQHSFVFFLTRILLAHGIRFRTI